MKHVSDFTLLTCTGDRPECLLQLQKVINRRLLKLDISMNWIIVDDGKEPFTIKQPNLVYIRRVPLATDPPHTLGINLLAANQAIADHNVIMFEDDDYYKEGWIETCIDRISSGLDLFGEGDALYYFENINRDS